MIEFKPEIADAMYRSFPEYVDPSPISQLITNTAIELSNQHRDSYTVDDVVGIGHTIGLKLISNQQQYASQVVESATNPENLELLNNLFYKTQRSLIDWVDQADIYSDAKAYISKAIEHSCIKYDQSIQYHFANIQNGTIEINIEPTDLTYRGHILCIGFRQKYHPNLFNGISHLIMGHELGHGIALTLENEINTEQSIVYTYGQNDFNLHQAYDHDEPESNFKMHKANLMDECFAEYFSHYCFKDLGFPDTIRTDYLRMSLFSHYASKNNIYTYYAILKGLVDVLQEKSSSLSDKEWRFLSNEIFSIYHGLLFNVGAASFTPMNRHQVESIINAAWENKQNINGV